MSPAEEMARRAGAARRLGDIELRDGLVRLLGPHVAPHHLAMAPVAARLLAEFRAAHDAAAATDWGLIAHEWPGDAVEGMSAVLQRAGERLGERAAWLLCFGRTPAAVLLDAASVLDNPLGFAGLDGDTIALADAAVPAGLWLARDADDGEPAWTLAVWGEPWLSATTRALREAR